MLNTAHTCSLTIIFTSKVVTLNLVTAKKVKIIDFYWSLCFIMPSYYSCLLFLWPALWSCLALLFDICFFVTAGQLTRSRTDVWGSIHPSDLAKGFVSDLVLVDEAWCNSPEEGVGTLRRRSSLGSGPLSRSVMSVVNFTDSSKYSIYLLVLYQLRFAVCGSFTKLLVLLFMLLLLIIQLIHWRTYQ